MSSLNIKHPDYTAMLPDWQLMADAYAGERAVKAKGELYLPATPSMVLDGMKTHSSVGMLAYERYKLRAVFWDFVSEAVERLVGMLHQKPANVKIPKAMEPLLKKASRQDESLQQLLRRINEQQLVYGRLGLLADLPDVVSVVSDTLPYIALYQAIAVANWDVSHDGVGMDVTKMVVLDETTPEITSDFSWRQVIKYRVVRLNPVVTEGNFNENASTGPAGVYQTGIFRFSDNEHYGIDGMFTPMYKGKVLNQIPFEFVNSRDTLATPDRAPLLGLARLCFAIYRGEADYRQSLFMQGQDTLVIVGGAPQSDPTLADSAGAATRVGAGATIEVNLGGDAKYIGVSATGLPEQRSALENDKASASAKAGQLMSPQAGKQESGDALTTRVSAQTANLAQVAHTGAAALEKMLKHIAVWMSLDPDEVSVEANTEFLDHLMTCKDLSDLMDARMKGSPMSLKTIHDNMVARGMTDLTFDEEIEQIILEKTMIGASPIEPVSVMLAATPPAPVPAK